MRKAKKINLALQGGGAHGAFTWGVLDFLLEEERIEIVGISGTSAGALNGAALKSGLVLGGRTEAKKKLDALWEDIGAIESDAIPAWMDGIAPEMFSKSLELSPGYVALDLMSRISSPYQFAALLPHPLEKVVKAFDYDRICATDGPELYICATNVRSGKIRIFDERDITTEAILASGCLPTLFKAVEIYDKKTKRVEAYWDGGYMGNPALFPLFPNSTRDIVIVNINPLHREEIPKTPQEIQNRINEISFNGSMFRELRAIQFVRDLLKKGAVKPGSMQDVLIHMISDDHLMRQLSVATKTVPTAFILDQLKSAGRVAAARFLEAHFDDLNEESSVNLRDMFS
ncbi:MAG: patatin-like phospholipase family protein [Litoreibacter sp.]|nr:patatin-like phospholipase family protein [Litoreibacter sp.]